MAGGKRKRGGHAAAAGKKQRKKERAALAAKTEAEVEVPAASSSDAQGEQEAPKEDETQGEDEDILSAELRAELGGKQGDVLVVVGKKKKSDKKERLPDEVVEQAARLSKTKRKKLEQIAARKVKEARRDELYKSLEQQQLAPQQLQLMYSSSRLGHRETLRERLKRSMGRHKAGIALTTEEQQELFQKSAAGEDGGEEAMSESSEEEADAVEVPVGGDKSAAPAGNKPSREAKKSTAETKPKADANSKQQQKKDTTPAKADSEEDEQSVEAGSKKRRKKNRSKQAFLASQASSQQQQQQQQATVTTDAPPASSTTGNSEVTSAAPLTALDQFAPAFRSDSAMEASSSSQSAAMAKLEALRRKNEEKRRQREATRDQPTAKQEEEEAAPHEVYVPQTIVLKNADEMRELSKKTKLSYKTTLVQLKRKPEIQLARMQLPVCSSEQEIMEAITENDVVILCGETGSGKTTQVPQFLYEAGYGHPKHPAFHGKVGVTQPRRVAAVSTAKRVAEELNVPFGGGDKGQVGYQIRYDAAHVGPNTRIKFMTDGILLKEIQQDFLLRQYSIVLLDEAHERNVNTDILIGLLSRIAPLRAQMAREEKEAHAIGIEGDEPPIQPLKLVIMSATLRVEDFTNNKRLFPNPPPVLRVDARQYPVTVHFNKRTELDDYVSEAYKKVVKIHKKLPEGGVLVFLTGQREISQLCRKLRRAYGSGRRTKKRSTGRPRLNDDSEGATASNEESAPSNSSLAVGSDRILLEHDDIEEEADREDKELYGADDADDADDVAYDLEEEEKKTDSDDEDDDEDDDEMAQPYMHVLPLYSLLPHDEQMKVFDTPPDRHRLIVVATNVAETSLTIPGIKYVVDAGRTKERVFDLASGVSSFEVQWISKASADQRAGRAGRTGPGHCYRLYSSAVYDTEFSKFASPEILRQPIEDLVLQMKAMGIHNVRQFPFPTPPDVQAVRAALATLVNLGAISMLNNEEEITALGRALVQFPVAARFAKMLLVAREMGLLEYTIAIVAALSGHSPFIHALDRKEQEEADEEMEQMQEGEEESEKKKKNAKEEDDMEREWREAEAMRRHTQWKHPDSDVLSLLRAAGAYAYTGGSGSFCRENHLHEKTMQNMLKLRQQLTRIVNALYFSDREGITLSPRMPPPDEPAQVTLRQIVAAGFLDNVAKRAPAGTVTEGSKIERNCAYLAASSAVNEPVYIHPHSCVFSPDPSRLPAFVVFQHIQRTSRAYLKTVTAVEPAWLAAVGQHTPLCSFSPPLTEPAPFFDVDRDQLRCFARPLFGVHQWALPPMAIAFPDYEKAATASGNDKAMDKYRWFAKLLLDGDVLPELRALSLSGALKEPSQTLLRKKFDKKIQLLVTKLQARQVVSRRSLAAQWRAEGGKRGSFLQPELRAWVRDSHLATFDAVWAKAVAKALA